MSDYFTTGCGEVPADLGTNLDDAILGRINDLERQRDELMRRLASGPAWHDRPTGPGIWMFPKTKSRAAWIATVCDADVADVPVRMRNRRCFGPIPPDPTVKRS